MQQLAGVGVALITPLNQDYSVDYFALEKLIDHVIEGGVDYLVVQGTTGESPVFSWPMKLEILKFVIGKNKGRKPIVFGFGGNHTLELIEKSKDLKDYPISSVLSVSPYYNKPSQKGIIQHYEMLANACPYPVILYNVPSRTASNMEAETTLKLAQHPNIIAIKEASCDLGQCRKICEGQPDDFAFLSGDDVLTLELMKFGAHGVISIIANLFPKRFTHMVKSALDGHINQAEALDHHLQTAYELTRKEGNPSSIKVGLEAYGICRRIVKPPLVEGSDKLKKEWEDYNSQG